MSLTVSTFVNLAYIDLAGNGSLWNIHNLPTGSSENSGLLISDFHFSTLINKPASSVSIIACILEFSGRHCSRVWVIPTPQVTNNAPSTVAHHKSIQRKFVYSISQFTVVLLCLLFEFDEELFCIFCPLFLFCTYDILVIKYPSCHKSCLLKMPTILGIFAQLFKCCRFSHVMGEVVKKNLAFPTAIV